MLKGSVDGNDDEPRFDQSKLVWWGTAANPAAGIALRRATDGPPAWHG